MKFKYLFSEFKPQKKCGPESVGALALTGGVASLIGNLYSAGQQSGNVYSQLAAQSAENQKNRDWQTQQASLARAFSVASQLRQQDFTQQNMALQQKYNMQSMASQAMYNSPVYQRKQLEAAGINPNVYFGQSSSFGGSSAQSTSGPHGAGVPSVPNVGSVQGLSPVSFQPESLQLGVLTNQIANNVKTLAEAKKLGVETGWIDSQMKAQIRALNTESDLKSVLKVGAELSNQLNSSTMPYQIKMASKNLEKTISEIELNEEGKITQQSIQKVNEAAARWHDAQAKLTDKESEKMGLEMPYYVNLLVSQINKNQGEAAAGYASAEESHASAESIKFFNSLRNEPGVRESLIKEAKQAGQAAVNANKISEKQAKQLDYMISQAAYADDNKEFTYWSNQVNNFVGTIGQAASQFYGAGALRELIKLRQIQQQPHQTVTGFTP